MATRHWSSHQLTEFLAAVSAFEDEEAATRGAVERAAEALEAEFGAVVRDGSVVASVGFPRGRVPEAQLREIADGGRTALSVSGLAACATTVVPLDDDPTGRLVLARAGDEGFSREDASLLRGMGRVLTLTLTLRLLRVLATERALRADGEVQAAENADLLASLQARQRLLDQLSRLQSCISHRTRLDRVLLTVVEGAAALVMADHAALHMVDPADPSLIQLLASVGLDDDLARDIRRMPIRRGAASRAMTLDGPVVIADYPAAQEMIPELAAWGMRSAVAVPVHEHGAVVGGLVVGSREPGRAFGPAEVQMLVAYAEQTSLAMAAARTADTMRHAFNDSLTGLPNRTLLLDRMRQALGRAQFGGGAAVTVLFLDLDGFKPVNDSLGHLAGDRLLTEVGDRLRRSLRQGDTAARLGGDEFAILLAGDGESPVSVAERILAELREPFALPEREIFVTASIGIASGVKEPEDLLRDADVAMYRAKRAGPGRYEIFEPGMHAAVVERVELEGDLRRAAERDELVLHYQPIVDLGRGRLAGAEALVRWNHPTRGLMAPAEFVPIAEETGLIVPLDRWVLREACRRLAGWTRSHGAAAPEWVSVNVSGRHLLDIDLEADIACALDDAGLEPARLMLEVTETVLVQDVSLAVTRLERLKALGVRIAIDDFGTGYSSLRYISRFPADVLKIAKPFVDDLGEDGNGALVQAIVALGLSLGLETVAEGIERAGQHARLGALGCGLGQGFAFGRPAPADAFEAAVLGPQAAAPALAGAGGGLRD